MLPPDFVPAKPFPEFKWKWASLQCTESLNDPVVLLGVLFRMRKLERTGKAYKYSSAEFAREMRELSEDIKDSVGVDLASRTGERNLIRNSGQYWRAVGLLADGDRTGMIKLSDFGRRVADRDISQTEFAAITLQTFRLPNRQIQSADEIALWEAHGLNIYPFRILLQTLRALWQTDPESHGFITPYELTRMIIPLSGCHAETADYVDFILRHRQGTLDVSAWPDCIPDANDFRIAREFLLFLSNYGYVMSMGGDDRQNEVYGYNTTLDAEIEILLAIQPQEATLELMRSTNAASDIERKRIRAGRPNQARFRRDVLQMFGRCVITNVTMPEVLEAAHIKPFKYNGEDTVANGLAMRLDIHLLFDSGHLRISEAGDVSLSTRARLDYGSAIPPRVALPDCTDRHFLRWRWENYDGL
jgi:hypothetical protein